MNQPFQHPNLPEKSGDQRFIDDILARAMQAQIVTPADYSMENAIKSAYLDIAQKGYLKKCTTESVINSVMDMVVQGLNPVKEQGYFIAYGDRLKFMRSYLGSIAVAKRFDIRINEVNYAAIYGGDKFKIDVIKGVRFVKGHEQQFENIRADNIIGAYAIALDHEGNEIMSDIMTFEEIKTSWERSQKKGEGQPILASGKLNPKSDHAKQPDRFSCRTVVNRLCKMIISVTDDKELLRAIKKSDEDAIVDNNNDVSQLTYNDMNVIDFDRSNDETKDAIVYATDDQCKTIFELHKKSNDETKIFQTINDIIGKEISGLRELTYQEAENCIDILSKSEAQEHESEQQKPNWAE